MRPKTTHRLRPDQTTPARTKPARRAPPKLASACAAVFAALARKTKFADPELIGCWPTIAGADLAALCRPGRITGVQTGRGSKGRTLEVITANGAAAAETQMRADELLAKVNRYLGPNAVARIAVRQSNKAPERAAAPRTASATDEASPLGDALSSFRSAVARRHKGS